MKVLFLTIDNVDERNLYSDLMRKFRDEGHDVFIVATSERRLNQKTRIYKFEGISILKVNTYNMQNTNLIEKGISTLLIEHQYLAGIKKYLKEIKFDLILYSTPPITFSKIIQYIKYRDGALSYLLLKDIFPQNAVDLEMIKEGGLIHRYFRNKEKKLYKISDFIGCMSPANVDYIIKHNKDINPKIVEENPNSIEPYSFFITENEKKSIRIRLGIPLDAITFIYGGNLGKPQGIDFLLEVLNSNKKRKDIFFMIIGSGTEYLKVQTWFKFNNPTNAILLPNLPKCEFDQLIQACDIGLIFLDRRFTIPNFPSRLLSYLEHKMPVIAATDINTDLGKILEENKFGYWAESGDLLTMNKKINLMAKDYHSIVEMGKKGYEFMQANYTVLISYRKIISHFKE